MRMALIVSSILSTWPCLTPLELARPKPRISSLPYSFLRPAMAAIFVVPISSPTIMGCSWFIVEFSLFIVSCFLLFIRHHRPGFARLWPGAGCPRVIGGWVFGYGGGAVSCIGYKVKVVQVLLRHRILFKWADMLLSEGIGLQLLGRPDHLPDVVNGLQRVIMMLPGACLCCDHLSRPGDID